MEKKIKGSSVLLTKVVPVVSLVAVIGMGAVTYNIVKNSQNEPVKIINVNNTYTSGSNMVVTEDSRDVAKIIQEKTEKGMIAVRMTQNWVFTDRGMRSNAYLANSQRNTTDLCFTVTLEDTGEIIMESPIVPIGSCIENFPLNRELEPGKYDAIVAHQQVENGEIINTVLTGIEITVQE